MEFVISLTKENRKRVTFWLIYILFFIFNVSLAWESYIEYEVKAGNIFTGICVALGVLGITIYFYLRSKAQKQ
jgi:hypothetical protein